MIQKEWKRAVCVLGVVAAVALLVAACSGLRDGGAVLPASAADDQSSGASSVRSGNAGLPVAIEQLDDVRFTTVDLRHFAGYNNFRAISEASADRRASSPFVASTDARRRFLLRGDRSNGAEPLVCVGKDAGR